MSNMSLNLLGTGMAKSAGKDLQTRKQRLEEMETKSVGASPAPQEAPQAAANTAARGISTLDRREAGRAALARKLAEIEARDRARGL